MMEYSNNVSKVCFILHQRVLTNLDLFVESLNLDLHAEIWSCQFSPGDPNLIATTSEDQSCKIWRINFQSNEYEMITELCKHDLAVTCVDWQLMHPDLGNVVGCCSDDKRIRAFKFDLSTQTFEKIMEFDFSFIPEFFTLTYMALEKVNSSQLGWKVIQCCFTNRSSVCL